MDMLFEKQSYEVYNIHEIWIYINLLSAEIVCEFYEGWAFKGKWLFPERWDFST